MIEIISIICLIAMFFIVGSTIYKIIALDREERIKYLKNFKKGKFVLIYPVAIPLYWVANVMGVVNVTGKVSVWEGLFSAIQSTIDLVVLDYDFSILNASDALIFKVAVIACFSLVTVNAGIFVFSLIGQYAANFIRVKKATLFDEKVNLVIGYNEGSKEIIRSIGKKDGSVLLLSAKEDEKIKEDAYALRCGLMKTSFSENFGELLKKNFKTFSSRRINVIVNTDSDDNDLVLVKQLSDLILSEGLSDGAFSEDEGVNVYVFGDPENESAFIHFVEKTKGRIHYINKYKLIAMDFMQRHPMTEFMTEKHLDYATATVRKETDVNAVFIGFGKTNRQVFLTSVANNQFLTIDEEKGGLTDKPVNYYVFDKEDSKQEKNLNHNYFRYIGEEERLKADKDYLPLPAKPANVDFAEININDRDFYQALLSSLLPKKEGNTAYNYVIIAFGKDMENIDMATKIREKAEEWGVLPYTHIFVKVEKTELARQIIGEEIFSDGTIIAFGDDKEATYNYKQIVSQDMENMARKRHLAYFIEYVETHKTQEPAEGKEGEDEKKEEQNPSALARQEWYKEWKQVQRESNTYACLSIRMKLHLLGYDYTFGKGDEKASREFLEKYTAGNPIQYMEKEVNGKKPVLYKNDMLEIPSVRYNYAVQEHQRWNAYMITNGFLPSSRAEIRASNKGKNFSVRKHGNLTTFEGLKEFRKIVAETYGGSEEERDVIRYDYQLMDDVLWLLNQNGYGIVKKRNK